MRYCHPSMRTAVAAGFGVLATLTMGSASGQQAASAARQTDAEDKATYEAVCGACHPVGMADGLRSELDWKQTVEEMVKIGAKATDQQIERVFRYLAHNMTKINVNNATAPQIAPVLAVTEATAQAIVKRRAEKGNFKTIEELKTFPGVDAAKLESRRDRVVF